MRGGILLNRIEEYIESVLKGNVDSFTNIISAYQQKIFRYCYHMLGNFQEAEDATQEVFLKVYKNLASYKKNTSFNGWIYKISYNYCISVLRKRKLLSKFEFIEGLLVQKTSTNLEYEAESFSEALHDALQKLSYEDRTILILRFVEDYPYKDIGDMFNKSPTTVRKRLERSKSKLRNLLEEDYNEVLSKA